MQAADRMGGFLSPTDAARNAQDTITIQQQLLRHAQQQARVGSIQGSAAAAARRLYAEGYWIAETGINDADV